MFVLFTVQSKICHAQTVWQFLLRKLFTLNAECAAEEKTEYWSNVENWACWFMI